MTAARRRLALGAVVVLAGLVGATGIAGVAGSQEEQPLAPTEAGIGGFDLRSQSAPLLFNVDTPTLALPRLFQLGIPYASTNAASGPSGMAIGSVLWPGPIVADPAGVLAQVGLALPVPGYPIRAQAAYPTEDPVVVQPAPGVRMTAEAGDEAFHAEATYPGIDLAGVVTVGSMSASSDTIFEEGVVTTTTRSEAARIELLGGLIGIGGLVSQATAASNGSEGRASGSVSPIEVTVGGQPAALGAEGLVIPGDEGATSALNRFLEQIGMEIRLLPDDVRVDDQGTATADAAGLFVRFGPSLIGGGAAGSGQRQLTSLLAQLLGSLALPPDLGNALNTVTSLVAADYRLSFVLGSSSASVLASPGFGALADTPFDTGAGLDSGASFDTPSFDTPVFDSGAPVVPSPGGGASPTGDGEVALPPLDTTSDADSAVPVGAVVAALLAAPAFAGLGRRFGLFALAPPLAVCPLEKPPKELR